MVELVGGFGSGKRHSTPTSNQVNTQKETYMPIKRNSPKPTKVPGIWKDGPERYLVRVWWIDPKTGKKRKREGVTVSLEKAILLKERLRGVAPTAKPSRLRFSDFAVQWIATQSDKKADSTCDRYVNAVAHAIEEFGDYWLDAIETRDVRQWRDRHAKEYANATVNGWHSVLKVVLDEALEDGLIAKNPFRGIRALTEHRTKGKRGTALSPQQFRLCVQAIDTLRISGEISEDISRMLIILAWTGIRRGELMALRFDDLIDGELHIERSVYRTKEKSTKTEDPRRVALTPPVTKVIKDQQKWLEATKHPGLESGLIFPASYRHAKAGATRRKVSKLSWFRSGSTLDKPLSKVIKEAGIPPVCPHSFRRTYEDLLRQAGVDELVRRSLAGWRSDDAQEIYAGIAKSERTAAGEAMIDLVMREDQSEPTPKDTP